MTSAAELARALVTRQLSAREVVAGYLQRIAERDGSVRAFVALDPDAVAREAEQLDRGPVRGPLHGLPVAVKDLIDTAALPTEYGCALYAGRRPRTDAAIVAALRAAGAIVIGKTVTSELGLLGPGPTRNPHDLERSPGGSSSGSAAAVADGMAPLALGTQTAGSVIRPAAYCGVVGYKPSRGRWERRGIKRISPRFDAPGAFARTVADIELLCAVLDGEPAPAFSPELRGALDRATARSYAAAPRGALDGGSARMGAATPRVVVVRPAAWERAEPAAAEALERAAALFDARERPLPDALVAADRSCAAVIGDEAAVSLAPEASRDGAIAAALAAIRPGPDAAAAARRELAAARAALADLFAGVDAIVTAPATGEAPPFGDGTGDPVFCRLWSGLGCPAVSVPLGTGPLGLPIAAQVVGRPGDDRSTLAIAAWLHERALERPGSAIPDSPNTRTEHAIQKR